ncbi:unnamed protein product [Albugo candida]|uniref:Cullin-5 n=1 Tax=Albugo candida TaxID=65357 RepID=A0A024FXK1_9STRA|nr:unnamed protein product [Albugo candida]|eukprot:CCI39240.1 unnamed protein product [Albugo candida]
MQNRFWIKYSHSETGQAPIPGVYTIDELAMHLWSDIVFLKIRSRIFHSVSQLFRNARDSKSIFVDGSDYISRIVESLYSLGSCQQDPLSVYRDELESPFLKDLDTYYSTMAGKLLSRITIAEYLQIVEVICRQEQQRCEGCLHSTTMLHARKICCRVLVEHHAERICEHVETFLRNNQTEDLRRIFLLFSELSNDQTLISFKSILKAYIERIGLDVVRKFEHDGTVKHPEEYIEALVQVRNRYHKMIHGAFNSHSLMRTALDQACRAFANSHAKLPEILAKYAHHLMTTEKKKKKSSAFAKLKLVDKPDLEDTMERKVENISVVFSLLNDKDVFKKFYAKYLAKRLIRETSVANDMEILLIQKLRETCGCDFVSKLQKMLKDKLLSKELNNTFESWIHEQEGVLSERDEDTALALSLHKKIRYQCNVLTAGAWPIATTALDKQLILPEILQAYENLFREFYVERGSGRKLDPVYHLSHGTVQSYCYEKQYEFVLSFYQIMILLQYNSNLEIPENQIAQTINIEAKDLRPHFNGLVKTKILTRVQEEHETRYRLNSHFKHRKLRVSAVPSAPIESPRNMESTRREMVEDRKMTLQAAIVRILKTRRDVLYPQLELELSGMLQNQFAPSTAMIKQNVEILIDKDFLKRHESNQQRLLYVA